MGILGLWYGCAMMGVLRLWYGCAMGHGGAVVHLGLERAPDPLLFLSPPPPPMDLLARGGALLPWRLRTARPVVELENEQK
eukprot:529453-Prorocentrum_minimum.AAC.1